MTMNYDDLSIYCADPKQQLDELKEAFSRTISISGVGSYKPRLALFDRSKELKFVISARPYVDFTDFKCVIAEMLYSYSSFESKSCILVLDSEIKVDDIKKDCLNLYLMNKNYCHNVQLLYEVKDDTVLWHDNDFRFQSIDLRDHEYSSQEMIEMLYVYIHLDSSPFLPHELLSYYSSQNYTFRSFKDLNISYVDFST